MSDGRTRQSSAWLFYAGAFAALMYLYLRTFMLPSVPFASTGDQVLFFSRALRMVHGQVLYRDVFEMVTPGTEWLYAGILQVFGSHPWVMQAIAVLVGLAFCACLTRMARQLVTGPAIFLPAALFLVFEYTNAMDLTHHWYSTLFAIAAVSALQWNVTYRSVAMAGFFCAIATLFTQTQGALVFLAILFFLFLSRKLTARVSSISAEIAVFAGVYVCVVGGVLLHYVHVAGWQRMIDDLVLFAPRYLSGPVNSPQTYLHQFPAVHSASDLIRSIPFAVLYALVPYIYGWSGYVAWRRRETTPAKTLQLLLLLHMVGLVLVLSVASGPRYFRLCTVGAPATLLSVWLIAQARKRWILPAVWSFTMLFAVILVAHRQLGPRATLRLPTGRAAFSDKETFERYKWFAEHTKPSEKFFNDAPIGLYLGLANPTAVEFINDDDFTRPEQVNQAVWALHECAPHFIVMQPLVSANDPRNHSLPFRHFVASRYRLAHTFAGAGGEQVWEGLGDIEECL